MGYRTQESHPLEHSLVEKSTDMSRCDTADEDVVRLLVGKELARRLALPGLSKHPTEMLKCEHRTDICCCSGLKSGGLREFDLKRETKTESGFFLLILFIHFRNLIPDNKSGLWYTGTLVHHHRTDPASLGAGSQTPRFNATVVARPLSCCGIATSVSFAMHLFNPLGVRSYRESRAVL